MNNGLITIAYWDQLKREVLIVT